MIASDILLRQLFEKELRTNILPSWINHVVDARGGFYGAVTNDLRVLNTRPRSAVLCARILWTYAAAYRLFGQAQYEHMARHAYASLTGPFWDGDHGGVYWALDARKHVYAQAFAIYGLSEYYRAWPEAESLALCQALFSLIATHTHDAVYLGNVECRNRDWGALEDMRLSERDLNSRKSMNTLLHLMEAYTHLLRIWGGAGLRARVRELLELFIHHIVDPQTHHFRLFFDDAWRSLSPVVSYGHDIEGSWLLVETATALGEPDLLRRVQAMAIRMAEAARAEGLEPDGGMRYEFDPDSPAGNGDKQWWAQAEAVVGFYNAYQLSSRSDFAEAAYRCWEYARRRFVDRTHGDWYKRLDLQGAPYDGQNKAGPWECPYHHSRACFEMLARLKET